MSTPKYLIDTNVFIGLEDAAPVSAEFAALTNLAVRHGVGVFVHEAAIDDIKRDKNVARKAVSLSKLAKFPRITKVMGLTEAQLAKDFGPLTKANDVVDATLLHTLRIGVADFVVTQDRGLHERTQRYAPDLINRVLFVPDALGLLKTTYEPTTVSIPFVEEVDAHAIPLNDPIFDSLRDGYPGFDDWWRNKCVKTMRKCWIVVDDGELAGLIVRKDEREGDTDAILVGKKILKICTFKVRSENRGIKLGELLLKQALWFAQSNAYDLVYLTTYSTQAALIELISYYGFAHTTTSETGELTYEKQLSREPLGKPDIGISLFEAARRAYPRFYAGPEVQAYGIPIQETFHENLFPELAKPKQFDLFKAIDNPKTPGNTIRKVYLCRAQANILQPGAILFFYKSTSKNPPSQAITTIGLFESMTLAHSTDELWRLAGGRSVYSDAQLQAFGASQDRAVKVINFLLIAHITPAIELVTLRRLAILKSQPPQSIFRLARDKFLALLGAVPNLGFDVWP